MRFHPALPPPASAHTPPRHRKIRTRLRPEINQASSVELFTYKSNDQTKHAEMADRSMVFTAAGVTDGPAVHRERWFVSGGRRAGLAPGPLPRIGSDGADRCRRTWRRWPAPGAADRKLTQADQA